jgi:hypothetical protein
VFLSACQGSFVPLMLLSHYQCLLSILVIVRWQVSTATGDQIQLLQHLLLPSNQVLKVSKLSLIGGQVLLVLLFGSEMNLVVKRLLSRAVRTLLDWQLVPELCF